MRAESTITCVVYTNEDYFRRLFPSSQSGTRNLETNQRKQVRQMHKNYIAHLSVKKEMKCANENADEVRIPLSHITWSVLIT